MLHVYSDEIAVKLNKSKICCIKDFNQKKIKNTGNNRLCSTPEFAAAGRGEPIFPEKFSVLIGVPKEIKNHEYRIGLAHPVSQTW